MNLPLGKFLFTTSQFFATNPDQSAYVGFDRLRFLRLFQNPESLKKKEGETDQERARREVEELTTIQQQLARAITTQNQEGTPLIPNELENILFNYQIISESQQASPQEFQEKINENNQKFDKFISKNPSPLESLLSQKINREVGKIAEKVVSKTIGKAIESVAEKVGAAISSTIPVIGPVIGWVVGKLIGKAVSWLTEQFIKNKDKIIAGLSGIMILGGILIGGSIGTILGLGGLTLGAGSLILSAGGIGAAAGIAGGAVLTFFGGLTTTVLGVIAIPLAISFVTIPILIALILFIINSGAYVVPSSGSIALGPVTPGCPTGWPIVTSAETLRITQGPDGTFDHRRFNEEAIDIGAGVGHEIIATHGGIATAHLGLSGYGNYVTIKGNCNGKEITTLYAHLSVIDPAVSPTGSPIAAGQKIALSGDTGYSKGSHLHYEFIGGIPMEPPYIPKAIEPDRTCTLDAPDICTTTVP